MQDIGPREDSSAQDGAADRDGAVAGDGAVDRDTATVPDGGGRTDAGEPVLPPERGCASELRYRPELPGTVVFAAGEWDWSAAAWVELTDPDGDGEHTGSSELPPGIWAYKLVLREPGAAGDRWLLDPANPYRKYYDGVENSALRVDDCRDPLLRLASWDTGRSPAGEGWLAAEVHFLRGHGGEDLAPGALQVTLQQGPRLLDPPRLQLLPGGVLRVTHAGLLPGKYTLRVAAADAAGRAASPLRLPFWVEAEPFSWRDAVIELVFTDRFRNGDPGNDPPPTPGATPAADWQGGDLAGVRQAIEEGWFDALGVRALWLTPFYRNPDAAYPASDGVHQVTGYHGYWPVRARELDPRLGTPDDLDALVEAAHRHGIRVLMDLVLNQVHEEHEYVAAHPGWFRSGCICGTPGCDWTERRLDCLFATYMPDIDWTVTEASEAFIADALWWLERYDLDGCRVDAVKHVEDLAVINLATRIHERLEGAGTEYYLLGETAMGWNAECETIECNRENYDTINRYLGEHGLSGQLDFVLFHATAYRVLARSDRGMIHLDYWTLASQDQYPGTAVMSPYIGSHDTPRFLSLADYRGQDAAHSRAVPDHRWAGEEELPATPADLEPYARQRLALTWLLTVPGAPLLYAGDEYGQPGGSDPDDRRMLRPEGLLSEAERSLLAEVRRVGTLRRTLAPLRRGRYTSVRGTEGFLVFARHTADETVLVALNGTAATVREELELPAGLPLADGELQDLLAAEAAAPIPLVGGRFTVELPGRGAAILVRRP